MLFYNFQALVNIDYSYETFSRHVPYYVKKAGPSDWGTCLCCTCLNSELKIEKLIWEKLIPSINLEYAIQNDDEYHDLLENIKLLEQKRSNLKINYVEWNLVSHKGKFGKETKISRKEVSSFSLCDFAKKLAIELAVLKEHLYRAHVQYRAFKKNGGREKLRHCHLPNRLGPRMLVSVRHKRKNLPIITLIKCLSIAFIHSHHKAKNRLLQYQITQIIRLVLFLQALNQFYWNIVKLIYTTST